MKLTKLSKLIRAAGLMLGVLSIAAAASAQAATRKAPDTLNDSWITTQIYAKFFADPDIKARNIDVDTTGGVVTLTGEVHSAAEKTQAIAKARGTDGVTQVVDKLTLTPGGRPMWFYVQMWLPLLPIVYVVSCAIDQQTNRHMWWHPEPGL